MTSLPQPRLNAVIIAVNPMPRLYIEGLVRELLGEYRVSIVTCYRGELFENALVEKLRDLGARVAQFSYQSDFTRPRALRAAAAALRKALSRGESDVFFCQPNHLLTNFLAFANHSYPLVRTHLIPDGAANFYLTSVEKYRGDMVKKRILGRVIGLPFTPYSGNYLGLDEAEYEDYWYFGDAGIMGEYLPTRRFEVGIPMGTAPTRELLFLGQPLESGGEAWSLYLWILRRIANAAGACVYKTHPAEQLSERQAAEIRGLGFEMLSSSESAEVLAADFAAVVGIASSVLLNLRMLGRKSGVFGVLDPEQISVLLGRNLEESTQIASSARALGVLGWGALA